MRLSRFFVQTLREAPAEAEIVSHVLMMRSGMIKKVAAGIYDYLPMGLRTIRKVENIVRDCMNDAGAIELLMPAIQAAELWQESGRWQQYGKELLRLQDRHGRDFCVGPTHEEVVTDVVRSSVKSYKQLPVNLYQIQAKFRDEVRPRFGLMRGREFIMKDAYSFDQDDAGANESYEKMRQAYCRIFERCGLKYKMVDADSGAIGGSFSHEFMVLASTGEDAVISCNKCDYAANLEKAIATKAEPFPSAEEALMEVHTPDTNTVELVAAFLHKDVKSVVKTMIVKVDEKTFAAVLVRGDHEANLIKVKNFLNATSVELAAQDEIIAQTGAPAGFLGAINLKMPIYADYSVEDEKSAIVGANKKDYHYTGALAGRDYNVTAYGDFRNAEAGDRCQCGGTYEITRGIEVGHIFKLGTKYSKSMNATFLDRNGKAQHFIMGCYGIGIGRVAAAAVEQNSDEAGIIWPAPIAPFEVAVMALNTNDTEVVNLAESIYQELKKIGVDVIIDDRDERAGVKLADADLIGYPIRVLIGKKSLAEGAAEVTLRRGKVTENVKIDQIVAYVIDKLKEMK
jgi:prolyl-tRNA synthetase